MRMFLVAAAALGLCAFTSVASAQTTLACAQNAQTLTGGTGTAMLVSCPAGCNSGSVWGSGIYSDDSSICMAAIHAGVFDASTGGTFTVTIEAGQSSYPPSTANGVTTSSWGSWGRSFTVSAGGAPQTLVCGQNAQSISGGPGTVVRLTCPAGCNSGSVWGTGTYSDDSSICMAAIHAGVIPAAAGGTITVTIAPGQPAYPPSTANGVTTSSWGTWGRSFVVTP